MGLALVMYLIVGYAVYGGVMDYTQKKDRNIYGTFLVLFGLWPLWLLGWLIRNKKPVSCKYTVADVVIFRTNSPEAGLQLHHNQWTYYIPELRCGGYIPTYVSEMEPDDLAQAAEVVKQWGDDQLLKLARVKAYTDFHNITVREGK